MRLLQCTNIYLAWLFTEALWLQTVIEQKDGLFKTHVLSRILDLLDVIFISPSNFHTFAHGPTVLVKVTS